MTVNPNYRKTLSEVIAGKSVASPSAQSTTLCASPGGRETTEILKKQWLEALADTDNRLAVVLHLLLITGARVSEVLRIKHSHIALSGMFKIVGAKGSNSRYYHAAESTEYMLRCKRDHIDPFEYINRYYVYREFRKVGITSKFDGHENNSVTHLPRHLMAASINQVAESLTEVADTLRHKSIKSTNHYIHNSNGTKKDTNGSF